MPCRPGFSASSSSWSIGPGQVVARQDLLDGVWKDAFVTDTSLAEAVSFLRQALGDDPQAPRYIQTVHRRGYRFLAPVVEEAASKTGTVPVSGSETGTVPVSEARVSWDLIPWSAALLCAGLAVASLWWRARQPEPEAPPVARFEMTPAPGTAFDRDQSVGRRLRGRPHDRLVRLRDRRRAAARSTCARSTGSMPPPSPAATVRANRSFRRTARWIGFFADGKLKKIAASGGSATSLADAPAPGGGDVGTGWPNRVRRQRRERPLLGAAGRRHGHDPDDPARRSRRSPPPQPLVRRRPARCCSHRPRRPFRMRRDRWHRWRPAQATGPPSGPLSRARSPRARPICSSQTAPICRRARSTRGHARLPAPRSRSSRRPPRRSPSRSSPSAAELWSPSPPAIPAMRAGRTAQARPALAASHRS